MYTIWLGYKILLVQLRVDRFCTESIWSSTNIRADLLSRLLLLKDEFFSQSIDLTLFLPIYNCGNLTFFLLRKVGVDGVFV